MHDLHNPGSRVNQIGSGWIITKPNIFGSQIQKSIAIELIIGYGKLIKPPQSLPSIRTYSTRMHLPKPILPQYTPTQGSRRTLSPQVTSSRKMPCPSRSQLDYLLRRVIRSAENNPAPVRRLSSALFGRVLAPLQPGSRAVRLEKIQGSKRRRFCSLSVWPVKLIRRVGDQLVTGIGGSNCSRQGRRTWL